MRWIDFDVSVAESLLDRCTELSDVLRGQGYMRSVHASEALDDFHGAYLKLFLDAVQCESTDRGRLCLALDDLVEQVRHVIDTAEMEEQRIDEFQREQFDGASSSSQFPMFSSFDAFSFAPLRPPNVDVSFSPLMRTRIPTGHHSSEKVGARPNKLRTFVEHSRGANDDFEARVSVFRTAWESFVANCQWARVGNIALIEGAFSLLAENRLDERWVESIAEAFETAGSEGLISEFEISLNVSKVDVSFISTLLRDSTLSNAQLTAVISRALTLPGGGRAAAHFIVSLLNGLQVDSEVEDIERARVALETLSHDSAASAEFLTALGPQALLDRIGLAGGFTTPLSRNESTLYAHALRNVFRAGEPHLASTSPSSSSDFARKLASFTTHPHVDTLISGNTIEALSFLLYDSALSTPFLLTLGAELEALEKTFPHTGQSWRTATQMSRGMGALFPEKHQEAAFDPMASYMNALGHNPDAALAFFTDSTSERAEYWIQRRHWGHDNFDGLLSALDAAITGGSNAGTEKAARLASSTFAYLANRTHGTDASGEPLNFYSTDETFTEHTTTPAASQHLSHILATHILAIDTSLFKEPSGSPIAATRGFIDDVVNTINIPVIAKNDLPLLTRVAISSDAGMTTLRDALTLYEDTYLTSVIQEHYADTNEFGEFNNNFNSYFLSILHRQAEMEGFFVKQVNDVEISLGRAEDDRIRAWITLGNDLVSSLPVDKIPIAGNMAEVLVSRGSEEASHAIEEAYTQNEKLAVETSEQRASASFDARRNAIIKAFYDVGHITREDIASHIPSGILTDTELDSWLATSFPQTDSFPLESVENLELMLEHLANRTGFIQEYKETYIKAYSDRI